MTERKIVRCYNCKYYSPRSKTKGYCRDLKQKVNSVDFCYEDQIRFDLK